ncbi:lipoic acid synthetase [Desulfarculus baarsii DSM 2075]|uniref:Multifunctional fusion protein n=1 Tax=Desulfarculus baarsii (strain ATCC 33931 / DSM 2075 / LMG 7858 / VKM B-1802 / 2st14) TaxID=644282 RepID=E1QKX6_DESB2|nr:lipoyl synthase [Desulfarculus baarsii]ADK86335.1 lipoic acid synthetase [Desulfarculus baarsii DSM 2075]
MTSGAAQKLVVEDWGLLAYDQAARRQDELARQRARGLAADRLVFVEHPPTVTLGRGGGPADLRLGPELLAARGVALAHSDRGGLATFHGPGQLVAYPIVELQERDLHLYVNRLLEAAAEVARAFGLEPERDPDQPGLWLAGRKLASLGVAVSRWVTRHGVAINVNNDLAGFDLIVPCGRPGQVVTSLAQELGRPVDLARAKDVFAQAFSRALGFAAPPLGMGRKPPWLRKRYHGQTAIEQMEGRLERLHLATVCQSAHCPNLGECFNRGTATFMILGRQCTRGCRFCAVDHGPTSPPDPDEPQRLAQAAADMGLRHVVVTSVTRDDLADGGAAHFAATIAALRARLPQATVEVLTPDFLGQGAAIDAVCQARPDVYNHNVETVPRLYPAVRPQADYARSLAVLARAAAQGLAAKSGLMLGLGETDAELRAVLADLLAAGCRCLTLGQYLAPSAKHAPVMRFVPPFEFDHWAAVARRMGFDQVAAGPLVRSSYLADQMLVAPRHGEGRR